MQTRRSMNHLASSCILLAISCLGYTKDLSEFDVISQFDGMLHKNVDQNGLFDQVGSLDVVIMKKNESGDITTLYQNAFGKSQHQYIREEITKIKGHVPSARLRELTKYFDHNRMPNVEALADTENRNLYRIASNTKTMIGTAALMFTKVYGLNLDEKVSPKYLNFSKLGMHHKWNKASTEDGYLQNFPNASTFASKITFRHMLTHRSGLSRESKKGNQYSYGSSRTSTPACPPMQSELYPCSNETHDQNWRPWTDHIISYMMPACGYKHYNYMSPLEACLPGTYYHYSNAGFSLLGLALDNFLKKKSPNATLEKWIKHNIFDRLSMTDTVFTWVDYDEERKNRSTNGCYGGETLNKCDPKRALTDYGDRGIKTPPGGVWSTTIDLANFLLRLPSSFKDLPKDIFKLDPSYKMTKRDHASEEDSHHMPSPIFHYGYGWYIAPNYTCSSSPLPSQVHHFQGAWGTVPGFTSYMMTNLNDKVQYAVVILRSYNYDNRLNIGNQARKVLYRLIHPEIPLSNLKCPVAKFDRFREGDVLVQDKEKSSSNWQSASNYVVYVTALINVFITLKEYL